MKPNQNSDDNPGLTSHLARFAGPMLMLLVVFASLWLLHKEFQTLSFASVVANLRSVPITTLLTAIGFTIANYAVLAGYDAIAVRVTGVSVPNRRLIFGSFVSYAFSNLLGAFLGGTPVRYKLYSAWGVSSKDVVRIIYCISVTFWLGLFLGSGLLFVFAPFDIPSGLHLPFATSRPLGYVCLIGCAGYYLFSAIRRDPIVLAGINLQPLPLRVTVLQTTVAAADFLMASAVLYVMLPRDTAIDFLPFVSIFLLAIFVALISHVPGGLGVLELVLVTMLPAPKHDLAASLITFRLIYYLLPFFTAVVTLAGAAASERREKLASAARTGRTWLSAIAPRVVTGAVVVSGVILLLSGSLPSIPGRINWLRELLPLPVIEVSHFVGSLIGGVLLILAHGLIRRIDAAWLLTIVALIAGIVASVIKGIDYEEAVILCLILFSLLPCRKFFFRRSRLFAMPLDFRWVTVVLMTLSLMIWLTLFAYRHVEYKSELWWTFAWDGDASRTLRALVGVTSILSFAGLSSILRSAPRRPKWPSEEELKLATDIVAAEPSTTGNLVRLRDKHLIFSDDRRAFVMFGCQGRCWIAMGDPIGPDESADDAAWKFREACDLAGARPVFYQVDEQNLSLYVDMGLALVKLGEEARIDLVSFSIEGSSSKDLRRSNKKAIEEGLTFEIVQSSNVPPLMEHLRKISDDWIGGKSAAEKGFSLGFFDERYLAECDIAVAKYRNEIVAFANLWQGHDQRELSIDLMRFNHDAPRCTMEFLFIQLMLWGHQNGFASFNLGMSPLSGIESHRLSPLWNRISNLIFEHGERFYNFQGLRNYKSKFHPHWHPKYLACQPGIGIAHAMTNVALLISGGARRLLRRDS